MLGTLVQVAKEMLNYEAERKKISRDFIELNHLCEDPRKMRVERGKRIKEEIKVLSAELKGKKPQLKLEDYKDDERWKYLYALSTGRHGIGPSWVINLEGKYSKGRIVEILKGIKEVNNGLKRLKEVIEPHKEEWLEECLKKLSVKKGKEEIKNAIVNMAPSTKILFTIQYDGKKGGTIPNVRAAFVKVRLVGEARAKGSGEHLCSICGKSALVRSSLPFRFSGYADKRVFSPMAFEMNSWKYAPVCEECTKWLFIAKDFLNTNLNATIAGKRAYLIPNLEPGTSKMPNPFIQYLYEFYERAKGRIVLRDEFPADEEPNPFGYLIEYNWNGPQPFRSAFLVFYQPGQKFLFLHSTLNLLPNQLKKLSENLRMLREECNLLGDPGKRLSKELRSDLRFVSRAWRWPSEQRSVESPLNLNPMRLAESLLTQNPPFFNIFKLDIDKLLKRVYSDAITKKIGTIKQTISNRVMLIWAIHVMFYGSYERKESIMHQVSKVPPEAWGRFFEKIRTLDTDAKRGIFLIGVLFGQTEYAQRRERRDWKGEMPILSFLRGLTISSSEIKERLFPQLGLKLRQLSAHSLPIAEVEAQASYHLARGGNITDEEARFTFYLGWALDEYVLNFIRKVLPSKNEKEGEHES